MAHDKNVKERTVAVRAGKVIIQGALTVPEGARGLVLFAHGSGAGRQSPRNRYVAEALQEGGLATLLMDLLTMDEEAIDALTAQTRFDVDLLAGRIAGATDWLAGRPETQNLSVGYFGVSTGAGAALLAAASRPEKVQAVVSSGGRPELAKAALPRVRAPTLLIVGGEDAPVIRANQQALAQLKGHKKMETIPEATHLFEEPGALEAVARLARDWFQRYLGAGRS